MIEKSIDFFFNIIKWVFNDFLLRIKIYGVPLIYYFLVLTIVAIVFMGLINSAKISRLPFSRKKGSGPNKK